MNIQEATPIELTEQERSALEAMIRSPKTEHGIVERARIVLLAAAGRSTRSIADELATWPGRVSRWRTRFARERLGGLRDLPRPESMRDPHQGRPETPVNERDLSVHETANQDIR